MRLAALILLSFFLITPLQSEASESPSDSLSTLHDLSSGVGSSGERPVHQRTIGSSGEFNTILDGVTIEVRPDGTGDYATIQEAINNSYDGDVVVLFDGTFSGTGNYDLDFGGREIVVRSLNGNPENCIIDCLYLGRGFNFHNAENSLSVVEGITIKRGATDNGGAIYITNSSPMIENCNFIDCNVPVKGGAVYSYGNSSPVFSNCIFWNNVANERGGGLFVLGGSPTVSNCTFVANSAHDIGGGVWSNLAEIEIENSLVINSLEGGGVHWNEGGVPQLSCCDLFGNVGGDWVGAIADQLGINGNISDDPLFCDYLSGDFSVNLMSPCSPETNFECGQIGALPVGCGLVPVELPYFEDFEDGIANRFEVIEGEWDVANGEYHCYTEEVSVKHFSVVGDSTWSDYRFSADIKTFGSTIQEMMVRYTPSGDWYLVTVRPEPYNTILFHKFYNGTQSMLAYGPVPSHLGGTWHNISIEIVGAEITAYFDGVESLSYIDEIDPILEGKAGVVAFAYTDEEWQEAFFDNVSVEEFHGISVPQLSIDPTENDPISCGDTAILNFDYVPAFTTPAVRGYSIRVVAENAVTFSASDFVVNTLPPGEQVYFQVVENGLNDFTLDYAILGQETEGITTPESLFSLELHGEANGVAGVSIAEAEFRDLNNLTILVEYDSQATIPVDCGPPASVTDAMVEPGHEEITVTWNDPSNIDLSAILIYRGLWHDGSLGSVYPTYGQTPVNMVPTQFTEHTGYASSAEWEYVGSANPGIGIFVDEVSTRGIYFYQIFAGDPAGNISLPMENSPSATNYILGDVAEPFDGEVGIADLSLLGDSYGVECGHQYYNAEVDVGPTEGGSSSGIPIPDCLVGFEDLMIFSFTFGSTSPSKIQSSDCTALSLAWVQNSDVEWSCILTSPRPSLKGLHVVSNVPGLQDAQIESGSLLAEQSGRVFFRQTGSENLDVSLAALGSDQGIEGTGELFRVILRGPVEAFNISIDARNMANEIMDITLLDHEEEVLPTRFELGHNYPNPFNPSTTIRFSLPEAQWVKLAIYSLDGRRIRTLVSGPQPAGVHDVVWDGRDDRGQGVSSGNYFYRIEAGTFTDTRKMVLMK